jgi:hypothetical protein
MNPVQSAGSYPATFSNGNLKVTSNSSTAGQTSQITTISMPATGNWYAEITVENKSAFAQHLIGIVLDTYNPSSASDNPFTLTSIGYGYNNDGNKRTNSTNTAYGATWTTGDVIGIQLNNGTLTFYKQTGGTGSFVSQGSAFTGLTGNYCFAIAGYGSDIYVLNTGQQPFNNSSLPTGAVALNTYNLPTSTIVKGNTVMDATLYTGNSGTQSVVNTAGFYPNLVWLKSRSNGLNHNIFDSNRGVQNVLASNSNGVDNYAGTGELTAFNSNGFTLVNSGTYQTNQSGYTYVAWQWQAGQGTTSNITVGQYSTSPNVPSIASTVSVNATAGFSVVTWTGTGSNATVGHGLGVAPSMIINKPRNSADNWISWHTSLGNLGYLYLNNSTAAGSGAAVWNSTLPTSSVFSVGTSSNINTNGQTMVSYCWSEIAGFSKFGSYIGNGSSDGPFIYTGFRPKFIMVKNSSAAGNGWIMYDTTRNTYNIVNYSLFANESSTENGSSLSTENYYDLLSNGFKARTSNAVTNQNGSTLIYMAFAENPFKNALAR